MFARKSRQSGRLITTSVVGLVLMFVSVGCPKSTTQQPGGDQSRIPGTSGQQSRPVGEAGFLAEHWLLEHAKVPLEGWEQPVSVVRVEGWPLIFTRQVFGQGATDQAQVSAAWDELQTILRTIDSGGDRIARLNIVAVDSQALQTAVTVLEDTLRPGCSPAITQVISPLPVEGARVALDAIAVPRGDIKFARHEAKAPDHLNRTDAVVTPFDGLVFFSGQPDKSPLPESAAKSLQALLATAKELGIQPADVLQLRVFLQPVAEAKQVVQEVEKAFGKQNIPPMVFTEWIATAPVEIEMIARLPEKQRNGQEFIRFYNPADVKPSPVFSRVALVQTNRLIFFPSILSGTAGAADVQAADVFSQLEKLFLTTGTGWKSLAKATYLVTEKESNAAMDNIRPKYLDAERPPAASKVTVHGVGSDRALSVDIIAVPEIKPSQQESGENP